MNAPVSQLSELVLARYGTEAVSISERYGVREMQTFLADRFDEEIAGLDETATELREGRIVLLPMGDGLMMMRVKVPG